MRQELENLCGIRDQASGSRPQGRPLRSPADYAPVSVLVVGAGLCVPCGYVPARLPGHETKLGGRAQGPPLRQEGRFPCVRATGRRGRRPLRHCHKISACPLPYLRCGGQRRQGRFRPGISGGRTGGTVAATIRAAFASEKSSSQKDAAESKQSASCISASFFGKMAMSL